MWFAENIPLDCHCGYRKFGLVQLQPGQPHRADLGDLGDAILADPHGHGRRGKTRIVGQNCHFQHVAAGYQFVADREVRQARKIDLLYIVDRRGHEACRKMRGSIVARPHTAHA